MLSLLTDEYADKTVTLSPDDRAVVMRELKEGMFALKVFGDMVQRSPAVDQSLAFAVLSVQESRVGQLCKLLGVEMDSEATRAERFAALRAANIRITNLERELGLGVSAASIQAGLGALSNKVELWWDNEGMGHVSETNFGKNGGLGLKLSCMLSRGLSRAHSSAPVTEAQEADDWLQGLRNAGFDLVCARGTTDSNLVDNDSNRALLEARIMRAFPSAYIRAMTATYTTGLDGERHRVLREIEVYVSRLEDVSALPAKEVYIDKL